LFAEHPGGSLLNVDRGDRSAEFSYLGHCDGGRCAPPTGILLPCGGTVGRKKASGDLTTCLARFHLPFPCEMEPLIGSGKPDVTAGIRRKAEPALKRRRLEEGAPAFTELIGQVRCAGY